MYTRGWEMYPNCALLLINLGYGKYTQRGDCDCAHLGGRGLYPIGFGTVTVGGEDCTHQGVADCNHLFGWCGLYPTGCAD
jgi:hypothetical protein